jgi:hypothetical protein
MKLPAMKGGASRKGTFSLIGPHFLPVGRKWGVPVKMIADQSGVK